MWPCSAFCCVHAHCSARAPPFALPPLPSPSPPSMTSSPLPTADLQPLSSAVPPSSPPLTFSPFPRPQIEQGWPWCSRRSAACCRISVRFLLPMTTTSDPSRAPWIHDDDGGASPLMPAAPNPRRSGSPARPPHLRQQQHRGDPARALIQPLHRRQLPHQEEGSLLLLRRQRRFQGR